MPSYTFAFIAFSDMSANSGDPFSTTETVGANGSFTVSGSPTPVVITVNDDDDEFDDAYIDPGVSQTLASAIVINGTYFPANSIVELEFRINTSTGETFNYIRINGQNVGIGGNTLPQAGESYSITGSMDGQDEFYGNLACFVRGTLIATARGEQPIETLETGDMVKTQSNGMQPVRWIGQRTLSVEELREHPNLLPVVIKPGIFGNERDLVVSPQHRIALSGWQAELYFGEECVLAPAKALINGTTIQRWKADAPVTYFHLMFDAHQVIYSENVATESFHPGEEGLSGLSHGARFELMALFPEFQEGGTQSTAYPVVKTRQAMLWSTAI
ncbi:MAG: Hint domain-containing protein [Paracoccaceae bacterium]